MITITTNIPYIRNILNYSVNCTTVYREKNFNEFNNSLILLGLVVLFNIFSWGAIRLLLTTKGIYYETA